MGEGVKYIQLGVLNSQYCCIFVIIEIIIVCKWKKGIYTTKKIFPDDDHSFVKLKFEKIFGTKKKIFLLKIN